MSCCGKVKNIIKGYTALALGKKYEFTDDRIRVCHKCEKSYWIRKLVICSICKCPIPAAARAEDKKCPLDKWSK